MRVVVTEEFRVREGRHSHLWVYHLVMGVSRGQVEGFWYHCCFGLPVPEVVVEEQEMPWKLRDTYWRRRGRLVREDRGTSRGEVVGGVPVGLVGVGG
jgi:hypothetical protein